ncbi:MAG: glycosyltransferase family 2 protein [Verrucomicrobiales bacterium]|nr:glycosyltransferase family 2 protein [Verrucomicrobiales bacterium]
MHQLNQELKLAVIIPLYNESEVLSDLRVAVDKMVAELPAAVSVYFIDDGSRDDTLDKVLEWTGESPHIYVVSLSRNFGHQAAIAAGLDQVGEEVDYVVIMDGDLQDPPELVAEMLDKAREGFDVVYARRRSREGETGWKRGTSKVFYRILRLLTPIEIPEDVGDFRLISRMALEAFRQMPEHHKFLRGMFAWIGFSQAEVLFDRPTRAAGETKYPTRRMVSLAWHAATSFSSTPLRLAMLPGVISILIGICYCMYSLIRHLRGETVPGWTALVFLVSMFGGSLLFAIWVMGEYIAKIYEEVKHRPHYLIKLTAGGYEE